MNSESLSLLTASYAWSIAQVTLFATVALAIYAVAHRQSSRHNVLLLAASLAIAAMLTLSFLSPWPSWNLADQWSNLSTTESPRMFRVSNYERRTTTVPLNSVDSGAAKDSSTTKTIPVLVPTTHERSDTTESTAPLPWLRTTLATFALLTFVGIARFTTGLWAVHRHRRLSQPVDHIELEREFSSLAHQLKIARPVALRVAPSLAIPATIGWLRPLVLMPTGFCDWSSDQRRAVFAHELAHIAERHYPLWLVGQFAVAANFYHPLVHWLGRRLRFEQELAADALALQVFTDRRAYANILAGLALAPTHSNTTTASLGLYMSRPLLMRRIAMLRQNAVARRQSRVARTFAVAMLIAATVGAIGLRAAPAVSAPDESTINSPAPASYTTVLDTGFKSADPATPTQQQTVTALFQVMRNPANLLAGEARTISDNDWNVFCRTQIAFLNSYFVIQAAVRDAAVKDLPLIKEQQDPVQWLIDNLYVDFIPNSEILFIRMTGKPSDVKQLRAIVDAVATAYLNEVVFTESRERNVVRDALQNSYDKLSAEVIDKMEELQALASELGAADQDGRSRILQELDVKRIDRIEIELLRLEDEQLAAQTYADELGADVQPKESAKLKFYEKRIADLVKRQAELEDRIIERNQSSVELATMTQELKQLQSIASEMNLKLESLDIEAVAPNRIRQIQKAM